MPQNKKKNKRAARGSWEQECNSPKRPNTCKDTTHGDEGAMPADEEVEEIMSDEENGNTDPETDEPSLTEIKGMFAAIQNSVSCLRKENRELKEEMTELKAAYKSSETKLSNIKTTMEKLSKENLSLRTELRSTKRKLNEQEEETDKLYGRLDDLEQYTRKNSLEIHGISQNAYTATEDVVIKLGEALNVPITSSDIEISHRLKRQGGNSPIVVKFLNHKIKSKLYRERIQLKHIMTTDLFPSHSVDPSRASSNRIFINENLTSSRRGIVKKANEKRREGTILSTWTIDGKIFIKTSPDGNPVRIYSEDDLDDL